MGARGPAPTPTKILAARGSWRAGERVDEPQAAAKVPTCPVFLSAEAKAEWRRVTKPLASLGLLSELDRAALAAYCEAWGEFAAICKDIAGLKEQTRKRRKLSPMLQAIATGLASAKDRTAKRLVALAAQFGLSPAARARLHTAESPEQKKDGKSKSRFFVPTPSAN